MNFWSAYFLFVEISSLVYLLFKFIDPLLNILSMCFVFLYIYLLLNFPLIYFVFVYIILLLNIQCKMLFSARVTHSLPNYPLTYFLFVLLIYHWFSTFQLTLNPQSTSQATWYLISDFRIFHSFICDDCIKTTKSWFSPLILIFISSYRLFVRPLTNTVRMSYRMSLQVFPPVLCKSWHTHRLLVQELAL